MGTQRLSPALNHNHLYGGKGLLTAAPHGNSGQEKKRLFPFERQEEFRLASTFCGSRGAAAKAFVGLLLRQGVRLALGKLLGKQLLPPAPPGPVPCPGKRCPWPPAPRLCGRRESRGALATLEGCLPPGR